MDNNNQEDEYEFLKPATPVTVFEREQAEAELEAAKPTIGEAIKASVDEDWMMSWALRGREEYAPDPDFYLETEDYQKAVAGLPEEYHGFVEEATSAAHLQDLRESALRSYENDKKLGELGWTGVGIRLGVNIADPGAIGVSLLTEGVAAPLIWGNKLNRLQRAFRGGVASATTNAAIEAYLVSQNAVKDPYDILYAGSAGLVLGGTLSSFGRVDTSDPVNAALANMAKAADDAQKSEIVTAVNKKVLGEGDEKIEAPTDGNPFEGQQVPGLRTDLDDFLDQAGEPAEAAMAGGRFDMTGYLLQSKQPTGNRMGRILGEDPVGFRKDATQVIEPSADILKTNEMKSSFAKYYQVYDDAYNSWAKEQNYGYFRRKMNLPRREFGELVADAIENPDAPNINAHVKRAAVRQAEIKRDLLRKAKDSQVKGFEEIPEDLTYFTHLWDSYKMVDARHSIVGGDEVVRGLFTRALVNGTEDLNEEAARLIVDSMIGKITRSGAGMDSGALRIFTSDQKDVIKDILIEEGFMTKDQADNLMKLFDLKPDGTPARAKRRLRFNMNEEVSAVDKATGELRTVRLKDFQERDAEQVFTSYAAGMAGRIGLAKVGIKDETMFRQMLDRNLAEAEQRFGNKGIKRAEKENLVAETIHSAILNRRMPMAADPKSNYARVARLLQDYNFIRLMNQVGFAQIAELGNAVSIGGFRGILQAVPEVRAMLKRAKDGTIEDDVLRDIEAYIGVGSDRLVGQSMNRADTIGVFSEGRGDLVDKGLFMLAPAKRLTADISGMAPITLALERIAARVAVQTLTDMAFKTKSLSVKRLAGLGLDSDMADKVYNMIKQNAVTKKSTLFRNRKVKAINLDAWEDVEARDAFLVAISRWTRRSIQQNDVGNLNLYMTSTMGNMLVQFRTFMLVSWAKQFLHNVKARDVKAAQAMLFSSAFAGMSYIAQTHVNAQFRDDKKEFLDERLSINAIAAASFQRSSWAALWPGLIDTGAMFFTDDPIFAYRSTGLDTNFITGNPTVQLVGKGLSSAQAVSRSLFNPDLQFSQGQQRALNTLMPWQNAIGIKHVLNNLVEMRPETTQVD